jgi:anti-sigma regulatory factor (Ser/Thr protein kinase)
MNRKEGRDGGRADTAFLDRTGATTRPGDRTMVEQRSELTLALPNNDRAPGLARRELASFARGADLHEQEHDVLRLLVSELVTNAVRHGGAAGRQKIGLCVRSSNATIRIEVSDHGVGFELPKSPPVPGAEGGYGLLIVDRLCSRWGTKHNGTSLVWCELDYLATA